MKLVNLKKQVEKFFERNSLVKFDWSKLPFLIKKIKKIKIPSWDEKFKNQSFLFYLLAIGLNFCFWHFKKNRKFKCFNQSGSIGLALAIRQALKDFPNEFQTHNLIENPQKVWRLILSYGKGELLLEKARIKIIKEIGVFLERIDPFGYDLILNKFENKSVNELGDFLIRFLPYTFKDISFAYGIKIEFFKKLRLLLADLIRFRKLNLKDKEELLIFADYQLPKLFIAEKTLIVKANILNKIKKKKLFSPNSISEIALRASSVKIAEEIKHNLSLSYLELDRRLWLLSKKIKNFPHHRTLTRFY